jgi:hypothetical protein
MKAMIRAVLAATVLAAPALSFAQSTNGPVTRAEVRVDMVQLEKAGYQPARIDPSYPADIQAAEARVHAESMSGNAYGGLAADGRSDAGVPAGSVQGHSIGSVAVRTAGQATVICGGLLMKRASRTARPMKDEFRERTSSVL